ncbi:hypothetical protein IGK20_002037 [Enterococcus sp. AZ112]
MIIPFSKIWFIVDSFSNSRLTNERIFAEYDLIKKQVVWKKWSNKSDENNLSLVSKIIALAPLFSPLIILLIIHFLGGYTQITATPSERLNQHHNIIPVILGILIFLSWDYFLLYIRKNQEIVTTPTKEEQIEYFVSINENTVRHNNAVGIYKTPYLVTIIAWIFLYLVIGLMFWIYNQPDTTGTFISKLLVLGILIATGFFVFWILFRTIVAKKILKKLRKEIEDKNE